MKRNIAIIAGGDSSELQVSLKSASGLYGFIDKQKYNLYIVTIVGKQWQVELSQTEKALIDKNDFSFMDGAKRVKFDFAYITIHGTPGENGILQGYLSLMGIPFSSCDVLTSAITFNKFVCNQYLKGFGVKISESLLLRKGQQISVEEVDTRIGYPCFVKPNAGGSSFGVTKVARPDQLQEALSKAFQEDSEVMVEALMTGTEVTCGMYKTADKEIVFPVTEVVPKNEFFDFDAKYNGQVEEITPARISDDLTKRIQQITAAIYTILNCKGIVRIDYIIDKDQTIRLLEVNTTPGMTTTSFIPQQVKAAGLDMGQVLSEIIENEFKAEL